MIGYDKYVHIAINELPPRIHALKYPDGTIQLILWGGEITSGTIVKLTIREPNVFTQIFKYMQEHPTFLLKDYTGTLDNYYTYDILDIAFLLRMGDIQ